MNSQIIKTCACGISYTKDGWHALELIGFQSLVGVPADAMASDSLELRNCSCGSTLHVEVNLLDIIGSANRALKAARDATREHSVVKGGLDLVGILLSRPDIVEKALDRAIPLVQDVLDKAKKGTP